jgi:transposase-like protein
LEVKLQMAKLSASKDAARAELRQQLELAEGMLKEHKKLAEARLASPSDELALQREVLRIKRQLHELEASDRPE